MTDRTTTIIAELARAIGFFASGNDADGLDIVRAIAKGADTQRTLPGIEAPPPKVGVDDARKVAAMELFRYWQRECDHAAARPTPERLTKVVARLRDGYSPAEIRKAIDGAKHSAFENDDGRRYDDLELICRNGTKLEQFIERGQKATGAIVVEQVSTGGIEEQIAALRRTMAQLRKDGRATEYDAHARDLAALMAKREGGAR